jgi:SH3-like domain-containing protein
MSLDENKDPEIFPLDECEDLSGGNIGNSQNSVSVSRQPRNKSNGKLSTKSNSRKKNVGSPNNVPKGNKSRYFRSLFWAGLMIFLLYKGFVYIRNENSLRKQEREFADQKRKFADFVKSKDAIDLGLTGFPKSTRGHDTVLLLEPTGNIEVRYCIKTGTKVFVSSIFNKKEKMEAETKDSTQVFFINPKDEPTSKIKNCDKMVEVRPIARNYNLSNLRLSDIELIEFIDMKVMRKNMKAFSRGDTMEKSVPMYWVANASGGNQIAYKDIPTTNICEYYNKIEYKKVNYVKITDPPSNIRSCPKISCDVIAQFQDKDGLVKIINTERNWALIETANGIRGYIHKSQYSFKKNIPTKKNNEYYKVNHVRITDPPSNVRSCPSVDCYVIAQCVEKDEWVKIINIEQDWALIETADGIQGYIHKSQYSLN